MTKINTTAKEMFEKLGYFLYQKRNCKNEIYAYEYEMESADGSKVYAIRFWLTEKQYTVYKYFRDRAMWSRNISIGEHQAITQQVKELGWIE